MVTVNKNEYGELQNLLSALEGGLDPTFAYGVMQDVMGGAQERHQIGRAQTTSELGSLYDMATQLAQQGATEQGVTAAIMGQSQNLPNTPFAQRGQGELMSTIDAMFPKGEELSGLVPADMRAALGESGAAGLGAEDVQFVTEQAAQLAQQAMAEMPMAGADLPEGFQPTTTVIEARNLLRSMFAAQGADEETLRQVDQLVTDSWYAYGGPGPGMQGARPMAGAAPGTAGDPAGSGEMTGFGSDLPFVGPMEDAFAGQDQGYSEGWLGEDPSWWEKLSGAPRSIMDDILGLLGG